MHTWNSNSCSFIHQIYNVDENYTIIIITNWPLCHEPKYNKPLVPILFWS